MKTANWLVLLVVGIFCTTSLILACDNDDNEQATDDDEAFELTSTAFSHMGNIPVKYTCENDDPDQGLSPPLAWANAPTNTVAFAVTVRDPDAPNGDCKHWGLINIPSNVSSLAEGVSPNGPLPEGSWQTQNYSGETAYAGPCPPTADDAHRYNFTLIALSSEIAIPGQSVTLDSVLPAIEAATIESTTLTGKYDRD